MAQESTLRIENVGRGRFWCVAEIACGMSNCMVRDGRNSFDNIRDVNMETDE